MADRDVTTVEVSIDTWKQLNMRREPGDSMDDVISRALNQSRDVPQPDKPDVAIQTVQTDAGERSDSHEHETPVPDELPAGVDRVAAREAIAAAVEYIKKNDGATMREIVTTIQPDYSLKYDVVELEPGERYRGAWWRNVVKPGLMQHEEVRKPRPGASEWTADPD